MLLTSTSYTHIAVILSHPVNCVTCRPGSKADTSYTLQNAGCGPCVGADKTAEKCAECDTDSCNKMPEPKPSSASTITALLLPLVAFLFTLF